MHELAEACGVSKATLYHYVRDKQELLAQISTAHVARLESLVRQVLALRLPPEDHLRELIQRFTVAYAGAQHEHRVLTEDVRFLDAVQRDAVVAGQRRVVQAFADALMGLERCGAAALPLPAKPTAMLLLGMLNWTFTWLRPGGALSHADLGPVVSELFIAGLRERQPAPAAARVPQRPPGATPRSPRRGRAAAPAGP